MFRQNLYCHLHYSTQFNFQGFVLQSTVDESGPIPSKHAFQT